MRTNTLKQQRANVELETIIEAFGQAMRHANKEYVTSSPSCSHESAIRFTPAMINAWADYIVFCQLHLNG